MKKSLFAFSLVSAALIYACGGGDGTETTPSMDKLLDEKAKSDNQQANRYAEFVASSTAKFISALSDTRFLDNLGKNNNLLQLFLQPDQIVQTVKSIILDIKTKNGAQNCDNGGTWTITKNTDGSTLITFDNCQINNLKFNGTMDYSDEDKNENQIPEKINATFHKDSTIELTKSITIYKDITIPENTVAKLVNNIPLTITGNLTNGDIYENVNNKEKINASIVMKNNNFEITTKDGTVYNLTNDQISQKVIKTGTVSSVDSDVKNLIITDPNKNKLIQNFGIFSEAEISSDTQKYKRLSLVLKKGSEFTQSGSFFKSLSLGLINSVQLENDLKVDVIGKFEDGSITKTPNKSPNSQDNNLPDAKADIVVNGGYVDLTVLGSRNSFKFENFKISLDTVDVGDISRQFSISGKVYADQLTCIMDRYFLEFSTEKSFVLSENEYCPHDGKLHIGNTISITAYNTGTENHLKGVFNDQTLFDSKCEDINVGCSSLMGGNNGQ